MSVNNLLSIGVSGITMQRLALETTSENISNVNTPGYSRQRIILETGPTNTTNGVPLGTGVRLSTIQRIHDTQLARQIAAANSTSGGNEPLQTALQQIEPLFNEISTNGLGDAVEQYFNAWQALSANPQGVSERQNLLGRGQTLVDQFNQTSASLTTIKQGADSALTGIATDITEKAKGLADLNMQISQLEQLNGNANELRDQRDYLLQELSRQVGITYAEQADGTVSVTLAGGESLVSGGQYGTVSTQVNGGTGLNDLMIAPAGGGAAVNVTATIGGSGNSLGMVGGTLQVRDSVVPAYLGRLDEMAFTIANEVNSLHQTGYGLNSATGLNFFTPPAAMSGYAAVMGLNITNTADIAAASTDPAVGGSGNNLNALQLAGVKTKNLAFSAGTTTVGKFYNSVVSKVGQDLLSSRNTAQREDAMLQQLNALRDSFSGVSLDEELINLMKYQKAFQASAKLINTATDMLDTLLGMVR